MKAKQLLSLVLLACIAAALSACKTPAAQSGQAGPPARVGQSSGAGGQPASPDTQSPQPAQSPQAAQPSTGQPAGQPARPAQPVPVRSLFPAEDWRMQYHLDDGTRSVELLLAEKDRLVQTYDGKPHITWLFWPDGLLRADPKGSGRVTLRYLPSYLIPETVWWQESEGARVWFHLSETQDCAEDGIVRGRRCWRLEVLNRGELTTFTFAPGRGVIAAASENTASPKESFRKTLIQADKASISAEDRRRFIDQAPAVSGGAVPEAHTATVQEFAAQVQQLKRPGWAKLPDTVDWRAVEEEFGGLSFVWPLLPRTPGFCAGNGSGAASPEVRILDTEWRKHPRAEREFWVPSVTLLVCNPGPRLDRPVRLTVGEEGDWGVGVTVPPLETGEAAGPVRVYLQEGVPARIASLWVQDGRYWPDKQVRVLHGEKPLATSAIFRRMGTVAAGAPAQSLPPQLAAMRSLAWSTASAGPAGGQKAELFLYAPDARLIVGGGGYCGAPDGSISALADQWGLYLSIGGENPRLALSLGRQDFSGGRGHGMHTQVVDALGMTVIFISEYMSCNIPTTHSLYGYDHATQKVAPLQAKGKDGSVGAAFTTSPTIGSDGSMGSSYYNNADGKHHTLKYRWDPSARMWNLESHTTQ